MLRKVQKENAARDRPVMQFLVGMCNFSYLCSSPEISADEGSCCVPHPLKGRELLLLCCRPLDHLEREHDEHEGGWKNPERKIVSIKFG